MNTYYISGKLGIIVKMLGYQLDGRPMKRTLLFSLMTSLFILVMVTDSYAANLKVENRDQAVQLVKQKYQGKVLNVQSNAQKENPTYLVKLLSDKGVVFYLQVNAVNGRISKK
jgi:hypothetical protein